jgi:dihydroorotate dehydrogenase (fumarate)
MADLHTSYLGIPLRNPLVPSASPLGADLDMLKRLEEAGASAVVLPSLFEEQIEHEELEVYRLLSEGAESFGEALSYFPELGDYRTGPEAYLEHLAAAKEALSIPVIGSLNGVSPGGWTRYARLLEEAGADAVELNYYTVAADPILGAGVVEASVLDLVRTVRAEITVPLAVKLGPHFSAFAHLATALSEAGADGLVLFNRFVQPDIDLEALEVRAQVQLSTSAELLVPLRWIAILAGRIDCSLAGTGGVHTAEDALKLIAAGADVTMLASALLQHGPGRLAEVLAEMGLWLDEHEYESVEQLKGSMSQAACPDPAAFERAGYMKALVTYAPRHL